MKKTLTIAMTAAAIICSCTPEETLDPASKLKFKAEIGQMSSVGAAPTVTFVWEQGDTILITPTEAKADVKLAEGEVVTFTASGRGVSAFFTSDKASFYPDETIRTHKFSAAYPAGLSAVASLQSVASAGVVSKANIPFAGTAEINTPGAGATVLIKMLPAAAVVGIPVAADFGPLASAVLKSGGSEVVTVCVSGDAVGEYRYVYAAIPAAQYSSLTAVLTDGIGATKEITLSDLNAENAKIYNLEDNTPVKNKAFAVDLTTIDFAASFIYDVKDSAGNVVAVVCKEYLDTVSNQQAITVYGTKVSGTHRVMDSADPVCLVAQVLLAAPAGQYGTYDKPSEPIHGGYFSFRADSIGYRTPGVSDTLSLVYAELNPSTGATQIVAAAEDALPTTSGPRTLVLTDRGDTITHRLVKMGRQIWIADNLATMKYNDGTDIVKVKAGELYAKKDTAARATGTDSSSAL